MSANAGQERTAAETAATFAASPSMAAGYASEQRARAVAQSKLNAFVSLFLTAPTPSVATSLADRYVCRLCVRM